ncbi:MAG: FAD/NAD(P)-binding protein [Acidobacteriota bacterium]|nr:FAD/NAD(P)-binding protein [Acidobacteriota bacterium]
MTPTAEPPATGPSAFLPRSFRVAAVHRETAETRTLELQPVDGRPAPAFVPGQFTMVYVFGVGEVPMSITGDPARDDRLVHTVRVVGAVSRAIAGLRRGAEIGIRGPFGRGWPLTEALGRDLIIVAGGVGLAPLRPVIYHVRAHRAAFGRVSVLYGARTPDELLYRRELARWRRDGAIDLQVTVDRASAGWTGLVGVPTLRLRQLTIDPARTLALTCGPEVMMRYAVRELEHCGLDAAQVHLSMERNMQCAVGLCGHCQFGPDFLCRSGPVLRADRVLPRLAIREL